MFPLTITLHSPAQLNAVLRALQPDLKAGDFASPAVGAAYEEAAARVAQHQAEAAAPSPAAAPKEAAAPAPKPAQTKAASPAPGPRTATVASPAADAPEKTVAAPAAAQPQASTAAAEPAAPVTYAQVAAAITNGVKINREKTVDTLAAFKVRKGPELKPEQYGPFMAALSEALEEVAA